MTTHMGEFKGLPPVRESCAWCLRGLSKLVQNCPHSVPLEAVASFCFRASIFTWAFLKCSVREWWAWYKGWTWKRKHRWICKVGGEVSCHSSLFNENYFKCHQSITFFPLYLLLGNPSLKTEQTSFKLFSCSPLYSFPMTCSLGKDSNSSSATRSWDKIEYSF